MNFVSSVFKKYMIKNDTTKENRKVENNIDQSITETSSVGALKEANSVSFKRLNQNLPALSVFEEEDCFQDAEINPTINTIVSTEMPTEGRDLLLTSDNQENPLEQITNTDVWSNSLSTGTNNNNQHSDFEIQIPKNSAPNEALNENGNVKMVSQSANTIEPDSLNDSMVDSLELVTLQDIPLTRQLIDSIETLQCETLTDLEVDKYESLEYFAMDSPQNLYSTQNPLSTQPTNIPNNTDDIQILELDKNFSTKEEQNKDDAVLGTSGIRIKCKENMSAKSKLVSLNDILDFPIKAHTQSSNLEELHPNTQNEAKEIFISDSTENFICSEHPSKSESALETLIRSVNHTFAINDSDENITSSSNTKHVSNEQISEQEQIQEIEVVGEKGDCLEQIRQEFVNNPIKLSAHKEGINYGEQAIQSVKDILSETEVEDQNRKCDQNAENVKKLETEDIFHIEKHIELNKDFRNTIDVDAQNSTQIPLKIIPHFENESEEDIANNTNNSENFKKPEIEIIDKQICNTPQILNKKPILIEIRESEGSIENNLPESNREFGKENSKITEKRLNEHVKNDSKDKRENDLGEMAGDNVQNNKPTDSDMEILNFKSTLIEEKREVAINLIQPIEKNNDVLRLEQKCDKEFETQNTLECQNIAHSEEKPEKSAEPKTEEIREDLAQESKSGNGKLNESEKSAEEEHESKSLQNLEIFQENLGKGCKLTPIENVSASRAEDLAEDSNNIKENSELIINMETQHHLVVETVDSTFDNTADKLSKGEVVISKGIDEILVGDTKSNKEKSQGSKINTEEKYELIADILNPKSITTDIATNQMNISHIENETEQKDNSVLDKQNIQLENEFNENRKSCSISQTVQGSKTGTEKRNISELKMKESAFLENLNSTLIFVETERKETVTDVNQPSNTLFERQDTKEFEKLEEQFNKEPEVIHKTEEIASNSMDKEEQKEQTVEQCNRKYERQDTQEFENLERQCAENFEHANKLRNEDILRELVSESNEQSYTTNENQDVEQDDSRIFYRQNTSEFEIMERQCIDNIGDINSLKLEDSMEKLATYQKDGGTDESNEFVTAIKRIEQHKLQQNESLEIKSQNVQELTTNLLKTISVVGEENNILYDRQDTQEFENLERQCKDMTEDLNLITDGILGELVAQSTNTSDVKTNDLQTNLRQSDEFDILKKVKEVAIVATTNNKRTLADKNNEQGNNIIEQNTIIKENTNQIDSDSVSFKLTDEKLSVPNDIQKEERESSLNQNEQVADSATAPSLSESVQSDLVSSAVKEPKNSAVEKEKTLQSNIVNKPNIITSDNHMKTNVISCMGAETDKQNSIPATDEVMEKRTLLETPTNCKKERNLSNTIEVPSDISKHQSKTKSVSSLIVEQVQETTNPKISNKNIYQPVHNEQNNRNEELKSKVDLLQQELDSIRKMNRRKDKRMPSSTGHNEVDKDIILKYKTILEEYEKHIVQQADDLEKLKIDCERNVKHFTNTEMAFSDVFEKYEKAKYVIAVYRKNEDILLENIRNAEDQLSQVETKCFSMKQQSVEQIRCAKEQVEQDKRKYGQEISKLQAQVKRLEIKASSLEVALKQKSDECQALAALCDDITGRNSA